MLQRCRQVLLEQQDSAINKYSEERKMKEDAMETVDDSIHKSTVGKPILLELLTKTHLELAYWMKSRTTRLYL